MPFSVCRPLRPAICRKRPRCQGQALRAAYAGLDMACPASSIKDMRAMGGDGSAGGCRTWTFHKFKRQKDKNAKGILARCQLPVLFLLTPHFHLAHWKFLNERINPRRFLTTYRSFVGEVLNDIQDTLINVSGRLSL